MKSSQQEVRDERYFAARKATIISVAVNIFLSVGKIIAGMVGNSAAILADGIHSASDLITDGVVLVAMRIAKQGVDEDHPYGHGKYETLATLFVSVALLAVAIGIAIDSWGRLVDPELTTPTSLALWAAAISILAKEAIFQYTYRLGKRYNAKAIIANAWHHRSDAVSSIAALIGVGGAMVGYPILDPLAAIAVAFILGKVGIELFLEALQDLTDSRQAIDAEVQKKIANLVHDVQGVLSAHLLNPRGLGPDIRVDVHVVVDGYLSVSEGHQIAEKVRYHLMNELESVTDVLVHVDPEEDHEESVRMFVSREKLNNLLEKCIADSPLFANLDRMTPHYRKNGVLLEMQFKVDLDYPMVLIRTEAGLLSSRLLAAEKELDEVKIGFIMVDTKRPVTSLQQGSN
ncbi:MAG: cation transporter [Magnetococcales bacterium]|nr:cation transporter [Magnetococcales bacterium]